MTAVGDVTFDQNATRAVCLMTAQTTTTSPPALATDGIPSYEVRVLPNALGVSAAAGAFDAGRSAQESTLMVASSAGSGTMTSTLRLWGYVVGLNKWVPVSSNPNDVTKSGFIYNGSAIPENTTDQISYSERLVDLGHYDRLYLQLTAVGGTATAIEAWLVSARRVSF